MSGIGIARLDLRTINELQQEMHIPQNDTEEIVSNFHWDFRKTTWYTQIPIKMRSSTTDDTLTFHTNMNFDYLISTDFCITLPALKVKKDYQDRIRISWTHNPGHNILELSQLKFDDDIVNSFDTLWLDTYKQFFMKHVDNYNLRIGNVPCLESWNVFMPRYNIKIPLPFYYRRDLAKAIPLFQMTDHNIQHVFKLKLKIGDLLRMQTKTAKGWKDIPCNLSYLDGAGSGSLNPPDLWGYYGYITDAERESEKCASERVYYYDDIVPLESMNTTRYGQTNWVDLECKYPCRSIFWVAQNKNAKDVHYYSNYTTNVDDHNKGWNPCEKISLLYGGSPRLDNMDSDHFDGMSSFHFFVNSPHEPGYNGYSFSTDPSTMDADIGIVFSGLKAKLLVSINNTDIFLKPVKTDFNIDEIDNLEDEYSHTESDKSDPLFNLQVRLLVQRKFTLKKKEDGKYKIIYDTPNIAKS